METNELINGLQETLNKERKHLILGPWKSALVVIGGLALVLVSSAFSTGFDIAFILLFLGISLLVLVVHFIYHLIDSRLLKRHRDWVEKTLPESGVYERLGLGWEQINEIYNHTPYPWMLFLGSESREIKQAIRLLSNHLTWYLVEPKRYIYPAWPFSVMSSVVMLFWLVVPISIIFLSHGGINPLSPVVIWIAFPFLLFPYDWFTAHYAARRKINAELLLAELNKRVSSSEVASPGVSAT